MNKYIDILNMFVLDFIFCKIIWSILIFNCVICFLGESILIVRLKFEKINKVYNMVKCGGFIIWMDSEFLVWYI